jgi:chromosome segregation ATPase
LKLQLQQWENSIHAVPCAAEREYSTSDDLNHSREKNDASFLNEIQQSLVQQSRQLKQQLEEEYHRRLETETQMKEMERAIENLLQKNHSLKKKHGIWI